MATVVAGDADKAVSSKVARSILVPLDGSSLAESALPQAVELAKATSSGLVLLQVVQSFKPFPYLGGISDVTHEAIEVYLEEAAYVKRYLHSVAERLGSFGPIIETRVLDGDPAASIARFAEDPISQVSGIVMCTHGRTGANRALLGDVAQKVLRMLPVPLLLVHPDMESRLDPAAIPHYKTLLVPLDGSLPAEQALYHARCIARDPGARLVLVSVVSAPLEFKLVKEEGRSDWSAVPWHSSAVEMAEYLDGITGQLAGAGLRVAAQVTYGDVVGEIVAVATSVKADMIVMATNSRRGLEQLMAGSTAERVLQQAELPVLLVRAKAQPEAG